MLFIFCYYFQISSLCAFAYDNGQSLSVQNTFDNRPFAYLERPLAVRPGYKILRLQYPSPMTTAVEQNNTVPADYYLPDGVKPGDPQRPAVICLHILDGNEALTDLVCSALAARGIPALAFKLPYYGERGLPQGPMAMAKDPKLFAAALEQTGFDVRRTVDLLASRPEIDPRKIGIAGISLGGIIAAGAAGGEPRIHRAALLLAGGDVLSIIHSARETKPLSETIKALPFEERTALEEKIEAGDPLRFASALRDRALRGQVLMINATADEVIPKKCTEKLADALAIPDKIVWLDGLGHYTAMAELPFALKTAAEFFARDLPPGVVPPGTESRKSELKKLADVLRQAAALLAERPRPGKQHSLEMLILLTTGDQNPLAGRLRICRDAGARFSLAYKLPVIGEIALGQNGHPWIVAHGAVLAGTENPAPAMKSLEDFVPPRRRLQFRSLAGVMRACAATPEVLLRFTSVDDVVRADGRPGIALVGKQPFTARLEMIFHRENRTLDELKFKAEAFEGLVRLVEMKINAPARPERFDPPAALPVKKVEQQEVYRMFADLIAAAESLGRM
ncbi:MAG: prolyl oligopeptidase family serine peptidase [Pirellulales bacterium]|nr:prolyl oligopeptidase family serine peptidase [Pirellulales bacterium]